MDEIVDVNKRARIDRGKALTLDSVTRGNDCDAKISAKERMSMGKLTVNTSLSSAR